MKWTREISSRWTTQCCCASRLASSLDFVLGNVECPFRRSRPSQCAVQGVGRRWTNQASLHTVSNNRSCRRLTRRPERIRGGPGDTSLTGEKGGCCKMLEGSSISDGRDNGAKQQMGHLENAQLLFCLTQAMVSEFTKSQTKTKWSIAFHKFFQFLLGQFLHRYRS